MACEKYATFSATCRKCGEQRSWTATGVSLGLARDDAELISPKAGWTVMHDSKCVPYRLCRACTVLLDQWLDDGAGTDTEESRAGLPGWCWV